MFGVTLPSGTAPSSKSACSQPLNQVDENLPKANLATLISYEALSAGTMSWNESLDLK